MSLLQCHRCSVLLLKRCCLSSVCYLLAFISVLFSIHEPNACKSPRWKCRGAEEGRASFLLPLELQGSASKLNWGDGKLYWGDGSTSCDVSYLSFMGLSLHPRWPLAGGAAVSSLGTSWMAVCTPSHAGSLNLHSHPCLPTRFPANLGSDQASGAPG